MITGPALIPRVQLRGLRELNTVSAYHLHGNFGGKFPSNGTGIFFLAPKTGTGLSCTIYKIPVKFSLSLDMKPGIGNPNKWYRKLLFFRKMSTGMNRSISILPGISGCSIQMVSAQQCDWLWFTWLHLVV